MSSDALAAIRDTAGVWGAAGRDAQVPDASVHEKRKIPQEG